MNLSDAIIHGTADQVRAMAPQAETLNELDAYGYTPLIQTAIVNNPEMAKIIIDAGADVNFTDLTGRSALHWAADNNNLELCGLLLKNGAKANSYTRAAQPILAMPVLRHQEKLKQLLYQYGAKLSFAQDFINGKVLGHRYELGGRVDIVDTQGTFIEIELEGFYLEFSLAIVYQSLMDFKINYGGKHLSIFFDKLDVIINAIYNAAELIKYQHYLVDLKQHEQRINQLLHTVPIVIPVIYDGHAINYIALGNYLVRCDRGVYGREHGTVILYKMKHPNRLNNQFIKNLIYRRQHKEFIDDEMVQQLGLKAIKTLPISEQVSGNCSWANVEAIVPAMMFLLLAQQTGDVNESEKQAMFFYEQWVEWDKNRALTFCIQSFNLIDNKARKAAKAALMAAILFQKYRFDNPDDREKADKIMKIFRHNPEYQYILKAYEEVFQYEKETDIFRNFYAFLDYYEIDLTNVKV